MPPRRTSASKRPPVNISWTADEQALMIDRAIAVQTERPNLSGLPLLRESMLTLPAQRRRKVRSIDREAWFVPGIILELKRRAGFAPAGVDELIVTSSEILAEMRKQTAVLLKLFGNGPPPIDRRA